MLIKWIEYEATLRDRVVNGYECEICCLSAKTIVIADALNGKERVTQRIVRARGNAMAPSVQSLILEAQAELQRRCC
jgi:hypothetical protein